MRVFETLRHIFTPHTSNNHRARALHPGSLLFYILLFIFIQQSLQIIHKFNPDILGYATDIRAEELLTYTNQKRQENGLSPLGLDEKLSQAAYNKALDMFNKDYWAHTAPDGATPWKFVIDAGYSYVVAGENLAKNFGYSKDVVEAWMNSPTHKDNILKAEYNDIGYAIVDGKLQGEETTLVVQMFGTEKTPHLAQQTTQTEPETVTAPTPTAAIATSETAQQGAQTQSTTYGKTRVLPYELAGIRYSPILDIRSLKRQISLFLLFFLVGTLFIDGYFVYAHKKVRIAGRNWAHIIFLLCILSIIYIVREGSIL